jgi:hypothetical protein
MDVILHCNYEEINALRAGARTVLGRAPEGLHAVAAPPRGRAEVEALLPRLEGDFAFHTLSDIRRVEAAVDAIVSSLRAEMDALVLATHPAHEGAVAAYFDFAHALAVLGRLREMEGEMEAVIEVVTGTAADEDVAQEFVFPD